MGAKTDIGSLPTSYTVQLEGNVAEPMTALLRGDPNAPISLSAMLEGDPDAPISAQVTANAQLTGNENAPISALLKGDSNAPISAQLTGNENAPITLKIGPLEVAATLKGDPNAPISTLSQFELLNCPRLTFDQVIELVRTIKTPNLRIQLPIDLNFAFSIFPLTLFGIDAIHFKICGEPQIILQDFIPNAFERCEVDCGSDCQPCDSCD
ncbi:MAG: hypothetical protein IGS38_18580 [Synechococcales cyanobacterium M58_A2018_015]|nr:hypothetical protein [Synechococcales cyanobacterium M58_A2018_015]